MSERTIWGSSSSRSTAPAFREALAHIRRVWEEFNPVSPFEYRFLDETYDRLYRSELRMNRVFGWFTGLAVFIACLGLWDWPHSRPSGGRKRSESGRSWAPRPTRRYADLRPVDDLDSRGQRHRLAGRLLRRKKTARRLHLPSEPECPGFRPAFVCRLCPCLADGRRPRTENNPGESGQKPAVRVGKSPSRLMFS